jgi:acylpyruvate hydrolase
MKLVTFRLTGQPEYDKRLGLILLIGTQYAVLDLGMYSGQAAMMTDMADFLRGGEHAKEKAQEILDSLRLDQPSRNLKGLERSGVVLPLEGVELCPPVPHPGKMICVARNYADHMDERDRTLSGTSGFPMGFIKVATSLIGDAQPIRIPAQSQQADYEVELAIIIGRKCKNIRVEEAFEYVAGYSVFNDVSARDIQSSEMKKGALLMGKNFDTFGPFGPWLVTRDDVPDPQNLDIRLRVNGEMRQNSNTRHMIHSIPELIAYWSHMTLEPGDVIATGTPPGSAAFRKPHSDEYYLKPGDLVEAWVERVGILRNPVAAC